MQYSVIFRGSYQGRMYTDNVFVSGASLEEAMDRAYARLDEIWPVEQYPDYTPYDHTISVIEEEK